MVFDDILTFGFVETRGSVNTFSKDLADSHRGGQHNAIKGTKDNSSIWAAHL